MATFGEFPGVQISTTGGSISAVRIGSAEKAVFIGHADLTEGTAKPADAEQVTRGRQADELFGQGSALAEALRDAFGNNVNNQFTYGVALPQYDESQSGTPDVTPLEAVFSVRRDDDTDDWSFLDSGETIDFPPQNIVNEGETGVYTVLGDDPDYATTLETEVQAQRGRYKMVKGLVTNEPNGDTDFTYSFDTIESDSSSDAMFEFAPTYLRSEDRTVMGGVGGQFAGAPITEPVYRQTLFGFDELRQRISRSEANDIRNAGIIPIKENGAIRIDDNQSTSEESDWERDFWRRRIVDRTILLAKAVGEAIVGEVNNANTRRSAERQIESQLRGLVRDGILVAGGQRVSVEQAPDDPDQVNIEIGVTPQGVAKRVDADITIDT